MSDQQKSLKQIMDFRLEKLDQLINNGINPYPVNFNSTHLSHEIIENFSEYVGKNVVIAGRIMVHRLLSNQILRYLVKITYSILLKSLVYWRIRLIFLKEYKSIGNVMNHF